MATAAAAELGAAVEARGAEMAAFNGLTVAELQVGGSSSPPEAQPAEFVRVCVALALASHHLKKVQAEGKSSQL
jgi:hypothetical protein